MRNGIVKGRRLGLAACAVALLLLFAALIVGQAAYSAPLARTAAHDRPGRP